MQLQTIKSRIRDDIVKGTFDPEARLTIDRLATRYGSSHMPIREALRELAGEGLVRFEPRRGARTLPIDRSFIDNLLTMRAELEPLLARQAAARMDREGLSELEMLQNAFEAAVGRRDDSAAIDMNGRFHSTINQIADNAEACAIVDRHWLLLGRLWAHYGYASNRFPGVISDHQGLLQAFAHGAADDAAAVMKAHVIKAKYQLLAQFDAYWATRAIPA
jgi:DNA-binding GntR family transcriptional regulator